MALKLVILSMVIAIAASMEITDQESEASNVYDKLTLLKHPFNFFNKQISFNKLGAFPYEIPHQDFSQVVPASHPSYGQAQETASIFRPSFGAVLDTPIVSQPPQGVTTVIDKQAALAPKLDFLYLLESFVYLLGNILNTVQVAFNNNYDFIISLINSVISKVSYIHLFLLNAISMVRNGLEFFSSIYTNLNLSLSKMITQTSYENVVQPHPVYGTPLVK